MNSHQTKRLKRQVKAVGIPIYAHVWRKIKARYTRTPKKDKPGFDARLVAMELMTRGKK